MTNKSNRSARLQGNFTAGQLHQRRYARRVIWTLLAGLGYWGFSALSPLWAEEPVAPGLIGHWPLHGNGSNLIEGSEDAISHGVNFDAAGPSGADGTAASFNGRDAFLEIPPAGELQVGQGDFSITAWVRAADGSDDIVGNLVSQYDQDTHTGFHLGIKTNSVTTSQANFRQLQFGIDADRSSDWIDRGRPGNALLAFAMCEYQGELYAGTCEPGRDESGHVYRFDGASDWIDLGVLDGSNTVTALAVHDGQLYAATGKYRVAGSALPESENTTLGGRIFRYEENGRWTDCGQLAHVEAIACLVVYKGDLYASSLYAPAGFFRYAGGSEWIDCGVPEGMRIEAMAAYNGHLYATSYDGGHVFRFDGESWLDCGQLGDAAENTQTYSLTVSDGRLYCGTWRSGRVYRFEEPGTWSDVGRLGNELEVMGMLSYNGRLIAGTLPLAEVYEYDGNESWRRLVQLDSTPDVRYRRAWTMAEHDGQVFCSTLPSGRIFSWQVGELVMSPQEFPSGWHHVAAVRSGGRLRLYLDGELNSVSSDFADSDYDLTNNTPLRIGAGPNDFFAGTLSDLRLFKRGLDETEIRWIFEQAGVIRDESNGGESR